MSGDWAIALRRRLGALRATLGPASPRRRSVSLLLAALLLIPTWQSRFLTTAMTVRPTHTVFASMGVHDENKFFFFLHHLGLYPLRTTAPILADTKEEAERQLRENGNALLVDDGITLRSGDRGRVYLYYPDALVHHRSSAPRLALGNALAFWFALMALFTAFWWKRMPATGALLVVLLGSDPFQVYATYRQENVFGWAITTALLLLAMHLPLMTRRPPRSRLVWALPVVAGLVLASSRTVRAEGSLMAASVIVVYLTLARARWWKRASLAVMFVGTLTLTGFGFVRYFEHEFEKAHAVMVAAGGTPYTGPLQTYHEMWHPLFCGLGDFDTKYGYKWDDRVGYTYALPILVETYGMKLPPWKPEGYTFEASYDGTGKYPIFFGETPHYNDIIRDKVLGDIWRDPLWYLGILAKRARRVLTWTPPLALHVFREPLMSSSPILGFACIPLALLLFVSRRWAQLKLLVFTLPLTAPALLVYSDRGMTNYSTYHYFGFAILLGLFAEQLGLRRPPRDV